MIAYTFKADIWSLGVVLYRLCTLRWPFDGNYLQEIAEKIKDGNYEKIKQGTYSDGLIRLIESMLQQEEE